MRMTALALFLALPALIVASCGRANDICQLQCDCEHCGDLDREQICNRVHSEREIADIYGCAGDWNALADCIEDNGTCMDTKATFTTREVGSCTAEGDTFFSCVANFDCITNFGTQFFCSGGTCRFLSCADGSGIACDSDDDCPEGVDKCGTERDALDTCLEDASDNNPFLFQSSGSGQPVPEPPPDG